MRPGLKFRWRDAAIVAVGLALIFGLVFAVDYRLGGVERFGFSLSRIIHGSSVDSDLPLDAIEARLAEHLTDAAIFDATADENRTFEIRDCIATYRRVVSHGVCENRDTAWWKTETFFDLRLLTTSPWSVDIHEMRTPPAAGNSSLRWKFESEAADRLRRLDHEYDTLSRKVEAIHGRDVVERLRAMSEETDKLKDRLFERNGRRRFYCNGLTTLLPEWKGEVRFFVRNEDVTEVIDLMHAYASRACPFDPAALE